MAWAGNLLPSGVRAPERMAESPAHPQLPSTVRRENCNPHRGSEASVGPKASARKGGPFCGQDAFCPGPARISGLTSHLLSLTLGAWGVGRGPDTITFTKAVGTSQTGALGPPVGVQPPAPPLPGLFGDSAAPSVQRGQRQLHPPGSP